MYIDLLITISGVTTEGKYHYNPSKPYPRKGEQFEYEGDLLYVSDVTTLMEKVGKCAEKRTVQVSITDVYPVTPTDLPNVASIKCTDFDGNLVTNIEYTFSDQKPLPVIGSTIELDDETCYEVVSIKIPYVDSTTYAQIIITAQSACPDDDEEEVVADD